jgi:uncharacterized protein (DUF2141 family)
MKRFSSMSLVLLMLSATPAFAAEMTVEVTGIQSDRGQVGCALHRDAAQFPTGNANVRQVWVPARVGSVTCRFDDVAPGTYAIAVAHDLNGNRRTDTNLLGIPTEAWGVSRNARPRLRAPTFDEAKVTVPATGSSLQIRIAR